MSAFRSVQYPFSVLIPTRNRPLLTRLAVEAALASDEDAEVIVSDNSDEPVALPAHPRLRILRSERVLSMPDNWERCLQAARGEWLLLHADKSRVVPGALRQVRSYAAGHTVATYRHAAFEQQLPESESDIADRPGALNFTGEPVVRVKRARDAIAVWHQTIAYDPNRPMLYSALVHRSVIERIQRRSPRVFVGMAPDVASSLQLLHACESYISTPIVAVLSQFPWQSAECLSNGHSLTIDGRQAKAFYSEFAESPLARRGLPQLGASVIFDTLLQFGEKVASHSDLPPPSWAAFVREATQEIVFSPRPNRIRLLLDLQRVARRHEGGAGALTAELVGLKRCVHRRLAATWWWGLLRSALYALELKQRQQSIGERANSLADALQRCVQLNLAHGGSAARQP